VLMRLIPQQLLTCTARRNPVPIAAAAWNRGPSRCVVDTMQAAAGERPVAACNFLPYA
jgi:hypothetical protein